MLCMPLDFTFIEIIITIAVINDQIIIYALLRISLMMFDDYSLVTNNDMAM